MRTNNETRQRLNLAAAIAGLTAIWLSSGCREMRPTAREVPADHEELPILRQYVGVHSHEARAMRVVVRDRPTLARIPIHDVDVDFTREMLLIVTLGTVTSDEHAVRIERVWRDGHRLRVAVVRRAPPANAPLVMASPYCVAVVPRCDLNVIDFAPEPPARDRSWDQSPSLSDG